MSKRKAKQKRAKPATQRTARAKVGCQFGQWSVPKKAKVLTSALVDGGSGFSDMREVKAR